MFPHVRDTLGPKCVAKQKRMDKLIMIGYNPQDMYGTIGFGQHVGKRNDGSHKSAPGGTDTMDKRRLQAGDGPVAKNDMVASSASMLTKRIRRMIRPSSPACDELHHRLIIIPGVSAHTVAYSVKDDSQRETISSKGGADGTMFGKSAVQKHIG